MLTRRKLIGGIGAGLISAPAIARRLTPSIDLRHTDAGGAVPIPGVNFAIDVGTGNAPYLNIASPSCTDNGFMCGSFFYRITDANPYTFWVANAAGSNFSSYLQYGSVDTNIDVGMVSDDATREIDSRTVPSPMINTKHSCIFSADTSLGVNNVMSIYIDGVNVTSPLFDTNNIFTPTFNGAGFIVGRADLTPPNNPFLGDIWRMWLAPGQKIHQPDGTISAPTLAKFRTLANQPVDVGSDGSLPTGVVPAFLFDGNAATFGTNKGSGGVFTQHGTFTTVVY